MNPMTLFTILVTLLTGTTLTMLSSHWLLIWTGLEMNTLALIPILMKKTNPRSTEAATKYFLTQTTASMLLMMAILINMTSSGQWTTTNMNNPSTTLLVTLALIMKLGLSPFHFWVPEVTQGVPLTSGMILLTWQKLAPISILFQLAPLLSPHIILISATLSILVGGWGGLNQTQLRKIMAYSSISHMGWTTAILIYNPSTTILNLLVYILLTLTTFNLLTIYANHTTSSLALLWNKNSLIALAIPLTLLSLGGLPPLTGFLPKWAIIQEMVKNNNIIMPTFMAIAALLNLYFYMRLIYSTALTMFPTTNNTKTKWRFESTKQTLFLPTLVILSTLLLPLAPIPPMLD
ncbi:NADH dehydrogenase subunit 2 (mitochondrion) [Galeopterus variegatus]|uniref:NADH-ubiquinone oxidoreductase chain 2 n=1 Tax=Galeopterus variegatus TaxID=482537 RepID=Q8LX64_GALVR|nr:NADH dehydrogenase subunit 2 [Galeopterus variegatus]CAD21794.1 NADH dehydrogenase subunit 2 [Galeopterus variegatus]